METETFTILEANITLPMKQLWDVAILAYGCQENALVTGIELSNEVAQNIIIYAVLVMTST